MIFSGRRFLTRQCSGGKGGRSVMLVGRAVLFGASHLYQLSTLNISMHIIVHTQFGAFRSRPSETGEASSDAELRRLAIAAVVGEAEHMTFETDSGNVVFFGEDTLRRSVIEIVP